VNVTSKGTYSTVSERYITRVGIVKKKNSPVTGLEWPRGFQEVKVPRFHACQPYAPAAFTPRKHTWYSFLLEAESTPEPQCDRKDYVTEKFQ